MATICPSFSDKWHLLSYHIETWLAIVMLAVAIFGLVGAIAGLIRRDERTLRLVTLVLGVVGLAVAGYIFYSVVVLDRPPGCGSGGCGVVDSSKYANPGGFEVFDRPLFHMSTFGIGGYLAILATMFWRGDSSRLAAFGFSAFGFVVSLALTYIELWDLCSICQWCVTSAVVMTMLFVVSTCRLIAFYGTDE